MSRAKISIPLSHALKIDKEQKFRLLVCQARRVSIEEWEVQSILDICQEKGWVDKGLAILFEYASTIDDFKGVEEQRKDALDDFVEFLSSDIPRNHHIRMTEDPWDPPEVEGVEVPTQHAGTSISPVSMIEKGDDNSNAFGSSKELVKISHRAATLTARSLKCLFRIRRLQWSPRTIFLEAPPPPVSPHTTTHSATSTHHIVSGAVDGAGVAGAARVSYQARLRAESLRFKEGVVRALSDVGLNVFDLIPMEHLMLLLAPCMNYEQFLALVEYQRSFSADTSGNKLPHHHDWHAYLQDPATSTIRQLFVAVHTILGIEDHLQLSWSSCSALLRMGMPGMGSSSYSGGSISSNRRDDPCKLYPTLRLPYRDYQPPTDDFAWFLEEALAKYTSSEQIISRSITPQSTAQSATSPSRAPAAVTTRDKSPPRQRNDASRPLGASASASPASTSEQSTPKSANVEDYIRDASAEVLPPIHGGAAATVDDTSSSCKITMNNKKLLLLEKNKSASSALPELPGSMGSGTNTGSSRHSVHVNAVADASTPAHATGTENESILVGMVPHPLSSVPTANAMVGKGRSSSSSSSNNETSSGSNDIAIAPPMGNQQHPQQQPPLGPRKRSVTVSVVSNGQEGKSGSDLQVETAAAAAATGYGADNSAEAHVGPGPPRRVTHAGNMSSSFSLVQSAAVLADAATTLCEYEEGKEEEEGVGGIEDGGHATTSSTATCISIGAARMLVVKGEGEGGGGALETQGGRSALASSTPILSVAPAPLASMTVVAATAAVEEEEEEEEEEVVAPAQTGEGEGATSTSTCTGPAVFDGCSGGTTTITQGVDAAAEGEGAPGGLDACAPVPAPAPVLLGVDLPVVAETGGDVCLPVDCSNGSGSNSTAGTSALLLQLPSKSIEQQQPVQDLPQSRSRSVEQQPLVQHQQLQQPEQPKSPAQPAELQPPLLELDTAKQDFVSVSEQEHHLEQERIAASVEITAPTKVEEQSVVKELEFMQPVEFMQPDMSVPPQGSSSDATVGTSSSSAFAAGPSLEVGGGGGGGILVRQRSSDRQRPKSLSFDDETISHASINMNSNNNDKTNQQQYPHSPESSSTQHTHRGQDDDENNSSATAAGGAYEMLYEGGKDEGADGGQQQHSRRPPSQQAHSSSSHSHSSHSSSSSSSSSTAFSPVPTQRPRAASSPAVSFAHNNSPFQSSAPHHHQQQHQQQLQEMGEGEGRLVAGDGSLLPQQVPVPMRRRVYSSGDVEGEGEEMAAVPAVASSTRRSGRPGSAHEGRPPAGGATTGSRSSYKGSGGGGGGRERVRSAPARGRLISSSNSSPSNARKHLYQQHQQYQQYQDSVRPVLETIGILDTLAKPFTRGESMAESQVVHVALRNVSHDGLEDTLEQLAVRKLEVWWQLVAPRKRLLHRMSVREFCLGLVHKMLEDAVGLGLYKQRKRKRMLRNGAALRIQKVFRYYCQTVVVRERQVELEERAEKAWEQWGKVAHSVLVSVRIYRYIRYLQRKKIIKTPKGERARMLLRGVIEKYINLRTLRKKLEIQKQIHTQLKVTHMMSTTNPLRLNAYRERDLAASTIQKAYRKYLLAKEMFIREYHNIMQSKITLFFIRGIARRRLERRRKQRRAAVLMQTFLRGVLTRRNLLRLVRSGMLLNAIWRKHVAYKNLKNQLRRVDRPHTLVMYGIRNIAKNTVNSDEIRFKVSVWWHPLMHIVSHNDFNVIIQTKKPQFIYNSPTYYLSEANGGRRRMSISQSIRKLGSIMSTSRRASTIMSVNSSLVGGGGGGSSGTGGGSGRISGQNYSRVTGFGSALYGAGGRTTGYAPGAGGSRNVSMLSQGSARSTMASAAVDGGGGGGGPRSSSLMINPATGQISSSGAGAGAGAGGYAGRKDTIGTVDVIRPSAMALDIIHSDDEDDSDEDDDSDDEDNANGNQRLSPTMVARNRDFIERRMHGSTHVVGGQIIEKPTGANPSSSSSSSSPTQEAANADTNANNAASSFGGAGRHSMLDAPSPMTPKSKASAAAAAAAAAGGGGGGGGGGSGGGGKSIVRSTFDRFVRTTGLRGRESSVQDTKMLCSFDDAVVKIPGCHGNSVIKFEIMEGDRKFGTSTFYLSKEGDMMYWGGEYQRNVTLSQQRRVLNFGSGRVARPARGGHPRVAPAAPTTTGGGGASGGASGTGTVASAPLPPTSPTNATTGTGASAFTAVTSGAAADNLSFRSNDSSSSNAEGDSGAAGTSSGKVVTGGGGGGGGDSSSNLLMHRHTGSSQSSARSYGTTNAIEPILDFQIIAGAPLRSKCSWGRVAVRGSGPLKRILKSRDFLGSFLFDKWHRIYFSLDGFGLFLFDNKFNSSPLHGIPLKDLKELSVDIGAPIKQSSADDAAAKNIAEDIHNVKLVTFSGDILYMRFPDQSTRVIWQESLTNAILRLKLNNDSWLTKAVTEGEATKSRGLLASALANDDDAAASEEDDESANTIANQKPQSQSGHNAVLRALPAICGGAAVVADIAAKD